MHLGSSGALTPLKMFCENMLTHVHKVIQLVVGTFEQRLETSLVECEQSDGATGALYRKDRGSQSDRMLVLQRPDAGFRVRSVTVVRMWSRSL